MVASRDGALSVGPVYRSCSLSSLKCVHQPRIMTSVRSSEPGILCGMSTRLRAVRRFSHSETHRQAYLYSPRTGMSLSASCAIRRKSRRRRPTQILTRAFLGWYCSYFGTYTVDYKRGIWITHVVGGNIP